MKPRSYTKEEFDALPSQVSPAIDWGKVQEDAMKPIRWQTGTFKAPRGLTPRHRENVFRVAWRKFEKSMLQSGWQHKGQVYVAGPYPYFDIGSQLWREDFEEYRFHATFGIRPKPVRIEIEQYI